MNTNSSCSFLFVRQKRIKLSSKCFCSTFYYVIGFTRIEARTGLRSCANNISEAIAIIHDRRLQLQKARKLNRAQRNIKNSLVTTHNSKWVNPRILHSLSEMGFDNDMCALALQKTDNDINKAVICITATLPFNKAIYNI